MGAAVRGVGVAMSSDFLDAHCSCAECRPATAATPVEATPAWDSSDVHADREPIVSSTYQLQALTTALLEACDQLVEHNGEYEHRTPPEQIARWRDLARAQSGTIAAPSP